jgi:hypothetical protein
MTPKTPQEVGRDPPTHETAGRDPPTHETADPPTPETEAETAENCSASNIEGLLTRLDRAGFSRFAI